MFCVRTGEPSSNYYYYKTLRYLKTTPLHFMLCESKCVYVIERMHELKSTRIKRGNQSEVRVRATWLARAKHGSERRVDGLHRAQNVFGMYPRPGLLQLWIPIIQWQAETTKGYSKSASWKGSQKRRPLLAGAAPGRWCRRHGSRRWNTPLDQEPPSSPPGNGSRRLT